MSSRLLLAIGDFSRATQLSVKMLRHYHQIGLLEPVDVDPATGYRRYSIDQVSTAQIIRRFRALEMPLDEIRAVIGTTDIRQRNALIDAHLKRLESQLAHTTRAVESLRELLEPGPAAHDRIGYRRVEATEAVAITELVDLNDAVTWLHGALAELYASLAAQRARIRGPAGGIFADELVADERGQATVFVSFDGDIRPTGRLTELLVPAAELATVVQAGSYDDFDLAYGTLATHVAEHAIAIDGPIREYYLVGPQDTRDETAWRTEIGWPVFRTTAGAQARE
ncbi:MerR family transcriptional regulator [Mycobacterium sp. 1100029.7]|nr:MerR family transcriptional regulator [Mycobacterium sp. 1100029.7]